MRRRNWQCQLHHNHWQWLNALCTDPALWHGLPHVLVYVGDVAGWDRVYTDIAVTNGAAR